MPVPDKSTEIRKRHWKRQSAATGEDFCVRCGVRWPCDVAAMEQAEYEAGRAWRAEDSAFAEWFARDIWHGLWGYDKRLPPDREAAETLRRGWDAGAAYGREAERGRDRPTIVCLCGSTRFYDAFQQANYRETMAGRIVLSVGFYPHSAVQAHGEQIGCTPEQKAALDALHLEKIALADEVLVLSEQCYIGKSTFNEIQYAQQLGKPIRWLEPCAEERFHALAEGSIPFGGDAGKDAGGELASERLAAHRGNKGQDFGGADGPRSPETSEATARTAPQERLEVDR